MVAALVTLALVGNFVSPVYVTAPPNDTQRVFVVEQGGTIRVVDGGTVQPDAFLTIPPAQIVKGGEQGLLGLAFDPGYATNRRFYVYYNVPAQDGSTAGSDIVVAQGTRSVADPDVADPGLTELVRIPHRDAHNHNGGTLAFGPDGLLYLATGDGGGGGDQFHNGQTTSGQLAKMLRFDPATPTPELYAYGLRNPYRFSFDRQTGDLLIGDVGQGEVEEIDFLPSGTAPVTNFGWNHYEGKQLYPGGEALNSFGTYVDPIIEQVHSDGWCAIIGGVVVRDPQVPALNGRYVYSDNCKGQLWSAGVGVGGASGNADTGLSVPAASGFGEDGCGRVYVASLNGPVYRLEQGSSSCPAPTPPATDSGGGGAAEGPPGGTDTTPPSGGGTGVPATGGGSPAPRSPAAVVTGRRQRLRNRAIVLHVRCPVLCRVRAFSPSAIGTVTRFVEAGRSGRIVLHLHRRARRAIAAALRHGGDPVVTVRLRIGAHGYPDERVVVVRVHVI